MSLGLGWSVRFAFASFIHKFRPGLGNSGVLIHSFYEWECSIFSSTWDWFLMGEFHLSY